MLLKGINDSVRTLRELSLRLIEHGILPYYLHQFDRVKGGSHFEVAIERKSLVGKCYDVLADTAYPNMFRRFPERPKIPL